MFLEYDEISLEAILISDPNFDAPHTLETLVVAVCIGTG